MSTREERRERRRREWTGAISTSHQPKGLLYADLSLPERLSAYAELNRRAWLATGQGIERLPRSEWPGEIIDLKAR